MYITPQDLLRKFKIKPCKVILANDRFTKIKMRCVITSQCEKKVAFTIKQTNSNTFSIEIKSNPMKTPCILDEPVHTAKRQRLDQGQSTIATKTDVKTTASARHNQKNVPFNINEADRCTFSNKIKSKPTKKRRSVENSLYIEDETVHNAKRQRLNQHQPIPGQSKIIATKTKTKSTAIVRMTNPKAVCCKEVHIGSTVLCKIKGYCPWPALVTDIDKNMVFVEFYGDHTIQKTTIKNLYSFEDSVDLIVFNAKRLKCQLFQKAVREAEIYLGIPHRVSVLTQHIN